MAMQYDGKTYRNLQEQVAYLTAKWQQLADEIDEVRAQIPSKMIVEELPEEGDPLITYYVGPKGTEPNLYYEVWVWVQEEPDGPFVWRELEDTDQVDLSGYLPIQDGVTTNPQAYVKNADGTQGMIYASSGASSATTGYLVLRASGGHVFVPDTPTQSYHATSRAYVDDNFLAKQKGTTTYIQLYSKLTDGNQSMANMSTVALAGTVAYRDSNGRLRGNSPSGKEGTELVNVNYGSVHYLEKQSGTSTYGQVYVKNSDGTQGMVNYRELALAGAIVRRDSAGQVYLPDQTQNVPSTDQAVSRGYVDAVVGQLLYLHDIEIIVTVDATNKLYIKAYLINGSSTAITAIDYSNFKRMDVQYGCFGVDVDNGTPCAVTKKPDTFVYGNFDEARPAYLYQYMSGGALVSGATNNSMSVTVTDSVITF